MMPVLVAPLFYTCVQFPTPQEANQPYNMVSATSLIHHLFHLDLFQCTFIFRYYLMALILIHCERPSAI
jgi:hypothetical protein